MDAERWARIKSVFHAAAEHKKHVVFEGAGHVPPRIEVIRETLGWLDRYLGPVGR